MTTSRIRFLTLAVLAGLALPAFAADRFILTTPPRESEAKARELVQPIADYLSRLTGKPFVFDYSDNWLSYQADMRKDKFDLIFDGPQFVSWRMKKLEHVPILKLPGQISFVVIAKKDNAKINELKDLSGRSVCGHAPPNLATLTMQYQFDNPARQPLLIETVGFDKIYAAVLKGKCAGGVLQAKLFETFDKDAQLGKVLFQSKPLPNQAISVSKRISPELRDKITSGLLSGEGQAATTALRAEFKGQQFQPVKPDEYDGHHVLLRDVYGFEMDRAKVQTTEAPVKKK
jgi:ABC-type phosphate/phosphonate transport system substrate-binding protein